MMNLGRILILPDRVSVSRPGCDVRYVPRTFDYMAIDSSFPRAQRLRTSGVVYNTSARNLITVGYGTTYPDIPIVELWPMNGNRAVMPVLIGDIAQTHTSYSQPFVITMYPDRFTFVVALDSVWSDYVMNWFYYVWAP